MATQTYEKINGEIYKVSKDIGEKIDVDQELAILQEEKAKVQEKIDTIAALNIGVIETPL